MAPATPFAEAVDARQPTDGSASLRLKITSSDARTVDQTLSVIRARLKHFGAEPASVRHADGRIFVSWARPNVPDSVVTLLLAPGHFQLRPLLKSSKGACVGETPPGKDRPNEEVRLSGTDKIVRCYQFGPSIISDPAVANATLDGTRNRLRLRITLASSDTAHFGTAAAPHHKSAVGCVLDAALLAAPAIPDLRPNASVVVPTLTAELARLHGAILVGGPYLETPRAEGLERSPT